MNDSNLELEFIEFLNQIFIENNLFVNYNKHYDYLINKYRLKKIKVLGDRLCFINCLILYHDNYLNQILTFNSIKDIYYNYFTAHPIITFNYDDYQNELIFKLNDYFDNKNYNSEICD